MLDPVAPVLHLIVPVQSVAVNVAPYRSATSVRFAVITGALGGVPVPIVIVLLFGDVPHELLHVAVYVPAPTSIVDVVAPLLHVNVPVQFAAVNVAFSVPHTVVLFDVILGAFGLLPVVITIAFDAGLSPQIFVHVAVYVPAVLTVILAVVAPVLHFKFLCSSSLSMLLSPFHILLS